MYSQYNNNKNKFKKRNSFEEVFSKAGFLTLKTNE
jgi:hypothetical protein